MKSSFYLKHDLDAREDDKMRALLMKKGPAGYGIYWMIAEDLHRNGGRLSRDYAAMSWEYRVPQQEIQEIAEKFGLFYDVHGKIACKRVDRDLDSRREASEKAAAAGRASGAKRALNARSTIVEQGEERRGEEGKDRTAAPSAADLSTIVEKLGITKTFDAMKLPFKYGDTPKGTPIIDLDVNTCESILERHKNLGFDLERAIRSRINLKKLECSK